MSRERYRVAIVFPADGAGRSSANLEDTRYAHIASALRDEDIDVEAAPYAEEAAEEIRDGLLRVDGVLVWVNPIQGGRDRSVLNAMLEDIEGKGVFVSARPEIIRKMGTKEVLFRTRSMGWGCDTRHYPTPEALRAGLPSCLGSGTARVLKQVRGNGGNGVWKIECIEPVDKDGDAAISPDARVRVTHATRGSIEEEMPLDEFLRLCAPYFTVHGGMIDQPYQPRLTDGMVRCYMVGDSVAGFGEQLVNALYPAAPGADPRSAPEPGPRLYYPPTRPDFQPLKEKLEHEWLAQLCETLSVDKAHLPMIWDADFLYGPKASDGSDSYVLCEINVSSVYPFPDEALAPLAAATRAKLAMMR